MPRVALVTGAGKGIGEAISLALAGQGLRIALAARTAGDLQRVAHDIGALGGQALPLVCDVTDPASVQDTLARIQAEWEPVTVLVNNAGAAESHKFLGHDDALWQRMLDVNLTSVYTVCKAAAPGMVQANWGRIINIASTAARIGGKYIAAYTAAKHGVLGLTRALAVELAAYNITVNAICPGYVDTPLTDQTLANISARTGLNQEQARAALTGQSLQARLIDPAEIAALAVLLAGDDARGITGQGINIDGGTVMS